MIDEHRHRAAMYAGGICYHAELLTRSLAKSERVQDTRDLCAALRRLLDKCEHEIEQAT